MGADAALLRTQIMSRLRSGEKIAAVAADTGVSRSTLYRWKRESLCAAIKSPAARPSATIATEVVPVPPVAVPAVMPVEGYVADMTGPGVTDQWGVSCADLGVSIVAPNSKLLSVFGDTFSGPTVGQGDWRSPVALIGTGDTNNQIHYEYAGGADPDYAQQLWPYIHDGPPWNHGGVSTVIPSDLLRIGRSLYLHAAM